MGILKYVFRVIFGIPLFMLYCGVSVLIGWVSVIAGIMMIIGFLCGVSDKESLSIGVYSILYPVIAPFIGLYAWIIDGEIIDD